MMKTFTRILVLALILIGGPRAHSQTLNWGSEVFSDLVDSHGDALDESLFVFELGSFDMGFIPDETNTSSWFANWRVFDTADYSESMGSFGSSVFVGENVTSSNPSASTISFAGLAAFIWIRNNDNPGVGTEWMLARADSWTFPLTGGDCCDKGLIEWSISDLDTGDTPVWGGQNGVSGAGEYTSTGGPYTLQTYTVVPEPSSALLAAIACLTLLLRRRRRC